MQQGGIIKSSGLSEARNSSVVRSGNWQLFRGRGQDASSTMLMGFRLQPMEMSVTMFGFVGVPFDFVLVSLTITEIPVMTIPHFRVPDDKYLVSALLEVLNFFMKGCSLLLLAGLEVEVAMLESDLHFQLEANIAMISSWMVLAEPWKSESPLILSYLTAA